MFVLWNAARHFPLILPHINAARRLFYFRHFSPDKPDFSGINRFYRSLRKMRGLFHIVNRIFVNIFL